MLSIKCLVIIKTKISEKIEFSFYVYNENLHTMNQTTYTNLDVVSVIINLLKMIDEDETIDIENHTIVKAVIYLADDYLTGDENFKNIVTIRESGFDVYPGEQDRFGWLIGCIQLKRGVIMFG